MGVDFIRQCAQTFTKRWDRSRLELCERTLFTQDLRLAPRTALAVATHPVREGCSMLIRADGPGLNGYDGITRVASFPSPPDDLVRLVREGGGYAEGKVVAIHDVGVVEVELC